MCDTEQAALTGNLSEINFLTAESGQLVPKTTNTKKVGGQPTKQRPNHNNGKNQGTNLVKTMPVALNGMGVKYSGNRSVTHSGLDHLSLIEVVAPNTNYPAGTVVFDTVIDAKTLTRMSDIASTFQKVRWHQCNFVIESSFTTGSNGMFTACFISDPQDVLPVDPLERAAWARAQASSIDMKWWDSANLIMPACSSELFTDTIVKSDLRLWSPGRLVIISNGGPNQPGSIKISMRWHATFTSPTVQEATVTPLVQTVAFPEDGYFPSECDKACDMVLCKNISVLLTNPAAQLFDEYPSMGTFNDGDILELPTPIYFTAYYGTGTSEPYHPIKVESLQWKVNAQCPDSTTSTAVITTRPAWVARSGTRQLHNMAGEPIDGGDALSWNRFYSYVTPAIAEGTTGVVVPANVSLVEDTVPVTRRGRLVRLPLGSKSYQLQEAPTPATLPTVQVHTFEDRMSTMQSALDHIDTRVSNIWVSTNHIDSATANISNLTTTKLAPNSQAAADHLTTMDGDLHSLVPFVDSIDANVAGVHNKLNECSDTIASKGVFNTAVVAPVPDMSYWAPEKIARFKEEYPEVWERFKSLNVRD